MNNPNRILAIHHCRDFGRPPVRPQHQADPYLSRRSHRTVVMVHLLTPLGWKRISRILPNSTPTDLIRLYWFQLKGRLLCDKATHRTAKSALNWFAENIKNSLRLREQV